MKVDGVSGVCNSEITFVVQGPVIKGQTVEVLKSIRSNFNESKIILSTWENTNIDFDVNLYDRVIFNKDPGNFWHSSIKGIMNNVDRQIVSTYNGLKSCDTKYAFKIRTDFKITGSDFLKYFDVFDKFNEEYRIVNKRILACTNATRNLRNKFCLKYPFHISDFAFFGLTEDLLNLFNIPLTPEEDKKYFDINKNIPNIYKLSCRFVPEQWIFLSFLRKNNKSINCRYYCDFSEENSNLTELYIVNNFTLLNLEQFNLDPFKKEFLTKNNGFYLETCLTHYDFLKLYKKYCDYNYSLPRKDDEKNNILYVAFRIKRFIIRPILKPVINIICFFIKNRRIKHKLRAIYN